MRLGDRADRARDLGARRESAGHQPAPVPEPQLQRVRHRDGLRLRGDVRGHCAGAALSADTARLHRDLGGAGGCADRHPAALADADRRSAVAEAQPQGGHHDFDGDLRSGVILALDTDHQRGLLAPRSAAVPAGRGHCVLLRAARDAVHRRAAAGTVRERLEPDELHAHARRRGGNLDRHDLMGPARRGPPEHARRERRGRCVGLRQHRRDAARQRPGGH